MLDKTYRPTEVEQLLAMYEQMGLVGDDGAAITINADHSLNVPNNPIIPYIEGDGIGVDVTPVMLNVVEAAVELRIPVWKKLGLVGFVDAGQVELDTFDLVLDQHVELELAVEIDGPHGLAAVALGIEVAQPIAQRRLGHARAPRTGDVVIGAHDALDGLLTLSGGEVFGQQLSDQAMAKQCHALAEIMGIVFHGVSPT